ncbi:MAG: hypothetical protein IIV29_04300 [Tidjanibacter sp.]|nr:hypothetical protein [Tidjanibacter sp.]
MAFTYLCAPFSVSAQSADSLALEALRLEREIFVAPSAADANAALLAKAEVRKQQGLYEEAVRELGRLNAWALSEEQSGAYYYQKALCQYLAADFEGALSTLDEARLYIPSTSAIHSELSLLEALAAGEQGEWVRSEQAANRLLANAPEEVKMEVKKLYATAPKLRNPMVAWYLSLVPGVGQFYAGEVWSGVVSLAVNGGLIAFGVGEAVAGHWLSAWLGTGIPLSNTYFVGQERAKMLTERRNTRVLRTHNDLLREILLQER